jgi:hypothetical protein
VRFIRSDLKLNIFGELFSVAPELQYEYVAASVVENEQQRSFSWVTPRSVSSSTHYDKGHMQSVGKQTHVLNVAILNSYMM